MTVRSAGLTGSLAFCLLLAASCDLVTGSRGGPLEVIAPLTPSAAIRVTGLSGSELRQLRSASFDTAGWNALLSVYVGENETVPIVGTHRVSDDALEFVPRFPLDRGRGYVVRVDPSRLPAPRSEKPVVAIIRISAPLASRSTTVARIDPTAETWPENMLRFYVHFSAPMARGNGTKHVRLVDDAGKEVEDAILAAYSDLWNPEATRLTVFFDPGRVKRGVGPNVKMGRAIVAGRRYAIVVDAEWPDAAGQPLAAPFRQEFLAGPAAYRQLSAREWKVRAPGAGTREPLVLSFPAPLDRALLERSIAVAGAAGQTVNGRIEVGAGETRWAFAPAEPWTPGTFRLVVATVLEDPAGNSLARPFETLGEPDEESPTAPETVELTFEVR